MPDICQEKIEEATGLIWRQDEAVVVNQPDALVDEIIARFGFTHIRYDVTTMMRTSIKAELFAESGRPFTRVPGQVFTASIPFTGSAELLEYDASEPAREGMDSRISVAGQKVEMEIGSAGPSTTAAGRDLWLAGRSGLCGRWPGDGGASLTIARGTSPGG